MHKYLSHRNLAVINLGVVSYFLLILLINYYKIDAVIIGVFRELFTIPMLLAQLIFLVLGILYLTKKNSDVLFKISLALLGICSVITIGSFF